MLAILRCLLLPFGFLYASIAWLRRQYFILSRKRRNSPIYSIAVGNLAVGGSGKTPMVLFIARHLSVRTAILSRGYKRKTKGFREVQKDDNVQNSGDEPLEIKSAQPDMPVFVCEDRLQGMEQIQQGHPEIKIVVLDDAFQHLPLRADKYVLLTDYQKPFYDDFPMPAGRLREFACNASGADVIVVTKCPANLDESTAKRFMQKLVRFNKPVFFCQYENAPPVNNEGEQLHKATPVIAVSGLADNRAFSSWAAKNYNVYQAFSYPDHHAFSNAEFNQWEVQLKQHENAAILTTRKDFVKMANLPESLKKRIFITFTSPKFLFQQEDAFIRTLF